jgi:hypothetical protein
MTPYDNAMHGTAEDNFNFFHSSSRIVVECAFGEIDLRWGILWRPLQFSLDLNCKVIDACMRIHNFIVDFREMNLCVVESIAFDRDVFDDDCRRYLATHLDQYEDEVYDVDVGVILVCREVDVPNVRKPIVKWWGDDGETMSEMKYQDVD